MSWCDLILRLLQDKKLYRRALLLLVPVVLVVLPVATVLVAIR